jgi:tetratricopeptide (TPR) repeat protein
MAQTKEAPTGVSEAYELRINGKADKAELLLQDILKSDTTNSLAYFELARTKHHMFLGGTQFSSEEWGKVMSNLQQAVRYAPDNEIFAYYYAYSGFLNAFISMMREQPDVAEKIAQTCDAFQAVLSLNPDCHAATLYLVDIYASLPEEMGGNRDKAGSIATELTKKDKVLGALASSKLLPETDDKIAYWQNVAGEAGMNAQVMEELGRAYLLKNDTENGIKYFQDAMQADHAKKYLSMNLMRYYMMSTAQNADKKDEYLAEAEKLVNTYINSDPQPVPSLKAYGYGILALLKMIGQDENGQKEYQDKASSIDPFYSRATGMAPDMLYCRPDAVKIQYSSFFMPF